MTENKIVWKKIEKSAHNFKENKELEGVLINKVPNQFQGNDFLIEDKNKNQILVFGKTALQSKLSNVPLGSNLKIVYLGEKKSDKTGRLYEDYDVYIPESISETPEVKEEVIK